jgi:hypothetical protein
MGTPQAWGAALSKANQSPSVRRRLGEGGWGRQGNSARGALRPGMRTPEGFDGASAASEDGHAAGVGRSPEQSEPIPACPPEARRRRMGTPVRNKIRIQGPHRETVGFFVCKAVAYKSAALHDLGKSSDFRVKRHLRAISAFIPRGWW